MRNACNIKRAETYQALLAQVPEEAVVLLRREQDGAGVGRPPARLLPGHLTELVINTDDAWISATLDQTHAHAGSVGLQSDHRIRVSMSMSLSLSLSLSLPLFSLSISLPLPSPPRVGR